ncbi:MAG TPA: polysaccharide deacetylase family protein [Prolixibacteraceae bacterium]
MNKKDVFHKLKNQLFRFLLLILFLFSFGFFSSAQTKSLAERLGYKPTDKLLIVNCDDVGMIYAANMGAIDGMEKGIITSGTIMTPCPWFSHIADYSRKHPEKDFGVHLTLTSEWRQYRWGSVAPKDQVKGLYDLDGYLWRQVEDVYAHATPEEALIEGRAQIQKALQAGIPVTHIDSHMGTFQEDSDFLKVYVQLAQEFFLPLRMASQATMEVRNQPNLREELAKKGLVFTDYFISPDSKEYKEVKPYWINIIKNLKPGVTELFIHASKRSEDVRLISSTAEKRAQEAECFTIDPDIKQLIKDQGVILIGYRPLLELQRKSIQR